MTNRINALSQSPGITPSPDEIILGQLGINAADGKVYLKRVDGEIICVGSDQSQLADLAAIAAIQAQIVALNALIAQLNAAIEQRLPIGGIGTEQFTCNNLVANNYIRAGADSSFRIGTDTVARTPPRWGWQNPSGQYATGSFNPQNVSLQDLAKRVAAIQRLLIHHGLASPYGQTLT